MKKKTLGERCGWICHLCLYPVDKLLTVPHPMAATRDHLIPRSQGGTHVVLAHYVCNQWRRDMDFQIARVIFEGGFRPPGWTDEQPPPKVRRKQQKTGKRQPETYDVNKLKKINKRKRG